MKITLPLISLAALALGCVSDVKASSKQDPYGNYASTSKYNAMEREEFTAAMDQGLRDFDMGLESMKVEASRLGPDAIEEYHGCLDELMESRRTVAAEVERLRTMLADEWRDQREDVAELYVDLRESLDEAYEEVVEEA